MIIVLYFTYLMVSVFYIISYFVTPDATKKVENILLYTLFTLFGLYFICFLMILFIPATRCILAYPLTPFKRCSEYNLLMYLVLPTIFFSMLPLFIISIFYITIGKHEYVLFKVLYAISLFIVLFPIFVSIKFFFSVLYRNYLWNMKHKKKRSPFGRNIVD